MKNAQELFDENIKSENLKRHCLEVEAIMKEVASYLGLNENEIKYYGELGLLHDLDFDEVKDLNKHGKKTAEILEKEGYDNEFIRIILTHNEEGTGVKREKKIDFILSAADNISGLIYAYALMRGGLEGMNVRGLRKKFKDKKFAENVRRDLIMDVERAGINLNDFFEISIKALQKVEDKILG